MATILIPARFSHFGISNAIDPDMPSPVVSGSFPEKITISACSSTSSHTASWYGSPKVSSKPQTCLAPQ